MSKLNLQHVQEFCNKSWDENIIPTLSEYLKVPNQSPLYDSEWKTNGYTETAIKILYDWVISQNIQGSKCEIKRIDDLTPIIMIEIEATKPNPKNVLLYGHMDKQPPLTEAWAEGLHPHKPVIKDGKLYGRGGADDGYSIFASVEAVQYLKKQNIPHDRYVILIEGSEESGSIHLIPYVDKFAKEIGSPNLVICLDSGAGNYDQLFVTSSLRGVLTGDLTVKVLDEATHSGSGSGIVASSFRIIRQLLDRIENVESGELIKELNVEIPQHILEEVKKCSDVLGDIIYKEFSWAGNTQPICKDNFQLFLNKTWKSTLSITGVDNIPHISNAGNVLRTHTTLKLSVRLPPTMTGEHAGKVLKETLESNPPYGSTVSFKIDKCGEGWSSPKLANWLDTALEESSQHFYGKSYVSMGEGGSIPFIGMLGKRFPAQFVITGLLGPNSNAHGPNEMLEIAYAKKLSCCVIYILHAQANLE